MNYFYNMLVAIGCDLTDASHYTCLCACILVFCFCQLICVTIGRILGGK